MDNSATLDFVHVAFVTRCCQAAVCAAMIYENLTTLDLEIELVWKTRWSMVKVLFLITRYMGNLITIGYAIVYLVPLPSTQEWLKLPVSYIRRCEAWNAIQGWGSIMVILSMQGLMQYRVSVMYNHSRRLIAFMVGSLICEAIATCTIFGIVWKRSTFSTDPFPGIAMCTITSTPRYFYAIWIPVIFVEFSLVLLSLNAGVQWYTTQRVHLVRLGARSHSPTLWYILLRDSISFPILTLSSYIVNLIVWETLPAYWIEGSIAFAGLAARVLSCRLILNLRHAYYLPFNYELDSSPDTISHELQFIHPTTRHNRVSEESYGPDLG